MDSSRKRTLMIGVLLLATRYVSVEQRNRFAQNLLERVERLPGVEAAAIGNGGMPCGGPRSMYSLAGQRAAEGKRLTVNLISNGLLPNTGAFRSGVDGNEPLERWGAAIMSL